jgi:glycosyltransferase involved in cell wall biosynthesis
MKILLIHQYFLDKGEGGGTRWNEMSKMWVQQGHEVTVLAGMVNYVTGKKKVHLKGKWFYESVNEDGVKVVRTHVSEAYNTNFAGRLWGYFSFVFSSIWAGTFRIKGKFDVIVCTSPPLFVGATALWLSLIKNLPFVFEIRDLWPESAIDTGILTNKFIIKLAYGFEKWVYARSTLINVLTPAFRTALLEKKGIHPEKIIFIPNAADFSMATALSDFDAQAYRKALNWEDKLVITYVGAHGVANHLVQLLDAAELLRNEPVLFVLVGDGMQKAWLMAEAQKRQLQNIQFLPSVAKQEVFKYILAADIGTSILKKVDTFKTVYSNKTFDYMSCRKPILMAIDGVSRELVEQAGAGLYVEPEDAKDFAAKVTWYLQNRDMIKTHGEAGYQYAKTHFDRTILASQYLEKLLLVKSVN